MAIYIGDTLLSTTSPASVSNLGLVKPDGTTTSVAADGTISVIGGGGGGADPDLTGLSALGNSRLQYIPFSINTGSADANGENNTLSFTSSTLSCASCKITSCDGRILVDNTTRTLAATGTSDGTYNVYKSVNNGFLSLNESLTINNVAPDVSVSGDTWLDTSVVPANLKVYDGSTWIINNDLVYIGSVTVASSAFTGVENRSFNDDFDINNKLNEIYPVIESYSSGASWYRVYSDNWCEQGGACTSGTAITFLKEYTDTNYSLTPTYSAQGTAGFTPSQTGSWIAAGYIPAQQVTP